MQHSPHPRDRRRVRLYGHRGARGLAPENTLAGFDVALALGVDFVDMDVVMTQDGAVVVSHDLYLNPDLTRGPDGARVARGRHRICDLTLDALQRYDVGVLDRATIYAQSFPDQRDAPGARIPTLAEAIRHVRAIAGNDVGFQVEIKNEPEHPDWSPSPQAMADAVARVLAAEGVTARAEVQAFDWRCLDAIQRADPRIATQYLTLADSAAQMLSPDPAIAGRWTGGKLLADYGGSIPRMIAALGGHVWGAQDSELTAETVAAAHAAGLDVVVWNWPDEPERGTPANGTTGSMARMLDLGVDGIIHDRPDVIRGLFAARGLPLPRPCPPGEAPATTQVTPLA
jgi:glycerophosphoryl diester phosphodiesterase